MAEQSSKTLEYAELLLKEGKEREARLLLVAFIKRNPVSVPAWWILSQAVEDVKHELDCLERVLQLEPGHQAAQQRVAAIKAPSPPATKIAPAIPHAPQPAALPTVSPFVFTEDEFENIGETSTEGTFDLFTSSAPWPAESPALEPRREEKSEVPVWAEPPAQDVPAMKVAQSAKGAPRKKKTWIVDVLVISFILCLLLGIVSYFVYLDSGRKVASRVLATQAAAQVLTNLPPQTLEPTWTSTSTFTPIPTRTRTPTPTPVTPTITSTLQYTLAASSIPSSAIGVKTGLFPPDFILVNAISGATVRLHDYLGKPILIVFWATWCPYCSDEMDALKDLDAAYQEQGLVLLAVNGGDSQAQVNDYRISHGLSFPLLLDPDYAVTRQYQAYSIPSHVFVGVNGRILFTVNGEMFYADLENKVKASMRLFPTPTP